MSMKKCLIYLGYCILCLLVFSFKFFIWLKKGVKRQQYVITFMYENEYFIQSEINFSGFRLKKIYVLLIDWLINPL